MTHSPTPHSHHAAPTSAPQAQPVRCEIREILPTLLYHFQWHLLRLEDGCRRSRFGSPASDAFLREYGERVDGSHTLVLGYFVEGHMRGAVELRSLQSQWSGKAEIAFSVEKAWQGQGIGTALMAAAINAARMRRIARLYLTCHALNRRMQRIAEGVTAKIGFENCECFAEIDVTADQGESALAAA